jgi:hypothetical protein
MKTFNNYFLFENKNNTNIICYHRSNDYKHMVNNDFKLELSDEFAMFGKAIYFSESPNIDTMLGKYICKFSINLEKPILDLNKNITETEAKELIGKFNTMFNKNIDLFYEDIQQIGDIFYEINEDTNWNLTVYYEKFIKSLGYKSFKYFGNYYTDFINKRGDYGLCYGVYNPNDITFVDGPF